MSALEQVPIVDETRLVVRPIRPDDEQRLIRMFHRLSRTSYYRRFFAPPPAAPRPAVLHHLTILDHDRREALVALIDDEIVAVARYDRSPTTPTEAEVAVLVEDAWQGHGVASFLFRGLARLARSRGVDVFIADVLTENLPAIRLARSLAGEHARVEGAGVDRRLVIPLGRGHTGA